MALVIDTLINSTLYIFIVIVPLGALILILRAFFGALSKRKKAKIVKERLKRIEE